MPKLLAPHHRSSRSDPVVLNLLGRKCTVDSADNSELRGTVEDKGLLPAQEGGNQWKLKLWTTLSN